MKEMLEQSPDLPCTRVVNDFRLYPFFTGTKKIAWFIHPKNSPFRFAFSTLKDAESFAKKYSNNHTDKFWFYRHWPKLSLIYIASYLDGLTFYQGQTNISYREQIRSNAIDAYNRK